MNSSESSRIKAALLDEQGRFYGDLMLLVDWVEQQRAIATFGYPKDNAFPLESLESRLSTRAYVEALIEAAEVGGGGAGAPPPPPPAPGCK